MADKHMSRREMLRNIGLVGVGAWAVPVLTSLPAHAATPAAKNPCKGIKSGTCDTYVQCGTCGDYGYAACYSTLGKTGKLSKKTTCGDAVGCDSTTCATALDCPKGSVCIANSNCCGFSVCAPKCKGGSIRHSVRRPAGVRGTTVG